MCLHTNEGENQSEFRLSSQKDAAIQLQTPIAFPLQFVSLMPRQELRRNTAFGARRMLSSTRLPVQLQLTCLTVFLAQDGTRCARIISQDVPKLSPEYLPNALLCILSTVHLKPFFQIKCHPLVSGNSRAGTRAGGEGARTGRSGAAASPEEVSEPNLLSFGHDFKI